MIRRGSTVLAAVAFVVALAATAEAATFRVNSTGDGNDANAGDGNCRTAGGKCTMRAAVDEANAEPGSDRIKLQTKRYKTSGVREDLNDSGDYDVAAGSRLTVAGAGMKRTTLDGMKIDRLFQVPLGTRFALQDVKITRGAAEFAGGGLSSAGTAVVRRVAFVRNDGGDCCGGISSTGTLTVDRSLFLRNEGGQTAGAISGVAVNPGTPGSLRISNSTFAFNDASAGGAITAFGSEPGSERTIVNSTFDGNRAATGGALANETDAAMSLRHVTIVRSETLVSDSGAIDAAAPISLRNSIVSLGRGAGNADCVGSNPITSLGFNFDSDGSCTAIGSDLTAANPRVAKLRANGGPTPTVALKERSRARNKVPRNGAGCEQRDQRGVKRPQGNRCDIGAFELERRRR
jgi:CSLREA domain-containing protein